MPENGRPIGAVIQDLKEEGREFVQTRIAILRTEMRQKVTMWKTGAILLALAACIGFFAFWTLTFALVALLMPMFEGPLAWFWAALVVSAAYLIIGGIVGWLGYREFTAQSMKPERTLRVLREDQVWLANEARSEL